MPGKHYPPDIQLNLLWGGYAFLLSEFKNHTFHLLGSFIQGKIKCMLQKTFYNAKITS